MTVDVDAITAFLDETEGESAPDAAHQRDHLRRVVRNAQRLATAEGARIELVTWAAWLHDCVSVPKDSPHRARASQLAAERATSFLATQGLPPADIEVVTHAIHAHSFSARITPTTLEAQVVQDADRLDALGAIGIARCLAVGTTLGLPLAAPDDPFCRTRTPNDQQYTLDHFPAKLLRLADTFQTASGRREAKRRTDVMRQWLDDLERELAVGG